MQFVHKSVDTKSRKICSVPQCSSYCTQNVSLHAFPTDPKLCKAWKTALKIGKPVSKYMRVCSEHFTDTDFTPVTNKIRRLKKTSIPSQKIPQISHSSKKTPIDRSDRHWLQKCTLKGLEEKNMEVEDDNVLDLNTRNSEDGADKYNESNLAEPSTSKKGLVSYASPLSDIFYEDKATETQFSKFFELPQILDSDQKLIHFTGINMDILKTITICAKTTSDFNEFDWPNIKERIILVLCKFKLNISFACLAILFRISKSSCTSIFYSTVSLLAVALKPAIYWPTKDEILKNMPKCFAKFKQTRVVLDCTEIEIQKFNCLKCRVSSYSHYKGTHTIKYLIGITPSGLISIVSAGFGGRGTDKAIFNYETILEKLDKHDAIMVDKGFLIEKECEENLIKLIRPPFLRKKKQFSKEEAEATADIARARVHVERAIQRIKIFKILNEQLNWYLIPYADEIMTIIAAIVNLSPPILADTKIN